MMSESASSKQCTSSLSKKRYAALEESWRGLSGDEKLSETQLDAVLRQLRDVMKFDPQYNGYTPEVGRRLKEYRQKMVAELGVSTYVLRVKGVKGVRKEVEENANGRVAESSASDLA